MFEFLKSKNNNDKESIRIDFESESQWPDLIELSHKHAIYIFKHSSRCGTSSIVLNRFEKQLKERNQSYYFLHIQGNRSLSNWLSEALKIRHESPQLIVIREAKVLAHDSHYGLLDILPKL